MCVCNLSLCFIFKNLYILTLGIRQEKCLTMQNGANRHNYIFRKGCLKLPFICTMFCVQSISCKLESIKNLKTFTLRRGGSIKCKGNNKEKETYKHEIYEAAFDVHIFLQYFIPYHLDQLLFSFITMRCLNGHENPTQEYVCCLPKEGKYAKGPEIGKINRGEGWLHKRRSGRIVFNFVQVGHG